MKALILILISSSFLMGCSSFGKKLRSWVRGKPDASATAQKARPAVSFKNQAHMTPGPRRQYKRQTRKSLENDSRLDERTSSLWVMEGQGAYLFSQNIVRMIGDALVVKLDGEPKSQLESKAKVINDLVKKIENKKKAQQQRRVASKADAKNKKEEKKPPAADKDKKEESVFKVKTVPTRIVERLVDGNYRVKGSQSFMIGRHQYKVNVTGIIRSEDFNSDGVSATKLLDPNFDIVSARKSMAGL